MLEQAVYAGRNHTAILAAALALLFAAPAQAADVARVPLGQEIGELLAAPNGGAWVSIVRPGATDVGLATPDNAFRTFPIADLAIYERAALAPDGNAWFRAAQGFVRVDSSGTTAPVPHADYAPGVYAIGPDGAAWLARNNELIRIAPDGTTTTTALRVDRCKRVGASAIARASDGAMWLADSLCGLIRLAPDGTVTRVVKVKSWPWKLAADGAGGVWFAAQFDASAGHVDAAGKVTVAKTKASWSDVAVAPDGSAWFAGWRCRLLRVTPNGEQTVVRAPIPANRIAFDPGGGLWLASPARLVHNEPAGACDQTPPAYRITPSFKTNREGYGTVSLAGLRRARGFKIRFTEPVDVEGYLLEPREEDPFTGVAKIVTAEHGATLRIPVSSRRLRSWAKRKRVDLELAVEVKDREGNYADTDVVLRVTK
jgi:streptogramin lyase